MQSHVAQLAADASPLLDNPPYIFNPDEILVNAKYCRTGYGNYTSLEKEAVKTFAEYEGLLLDPVYTWRAAGGLIDLIKKGFFKKMNVYYSGTPVDSQHFLLQNTSELRK